MELINKYWLKISVALYVLGFVVHNVYLSQFGSHEFELIQAKYILSGFGLVGFVAICVAYMSIQVNLTYIADSLQIDKLLPWALRIVSLPYVIYSVLYIDDIVQGLGDTTNTFHSIMFIAFSLANYIVLMSLNDIVFMLSKGNGILARIMRSIYRILAIPMVLVTFVIAWNVPEFSGIFKTVIYFFFAFMVVALYQSDKKYGVKANYLDEGASENHESAFAMFVGLLCIFFILWTVVSDYTKYIYPNIPVALGGSKIQHVTIFTDNNTIDAGLIQETSSWMLFKNNETEQIEKIKSDTVKKIIYLHNNEKAPNN